MDRAWIEINLLDLKNNYEIIKQRLKDNAEIMAVVKANAYGHGAVNVSKYLNELGVNYFAVASLKEALELRQSGLNSKILILGYTDREECNELAEYNITGNIGNFQQAKRISDELKRLDKSANYHIAINTGMNRLGFNINESDIEDIIKISKMERINITGIGTHLYSAYAKTDEITNSQIKIFDELLAILKEKGLSFDQIHVANSFGSLYCPNSHYTLVRPGSALFNLAPVEFLKGDDKELLRDVMSIKAKIVNIRNLKKGETVGYDGTFTANEDLKIATIPIGYVDGIYRKLANKGRVLVKSVFCNMVGIICMDAMMINVTNVPNIKVGDIVTIMGKDGDKMIDVHELCALSETNACAFTSRIGNRLKYIYKK